MPKTLRLSLDIGFEDDASDDTIKGVKKEFNQCLKEALIDILQNNSVISFNILDDGVKEGDA